MNASLGLTAASNTHPTPNKGRIHGIINFQEIAEVKASKDPRMKLEGILHMAVKIASLEILEVTEPTRQFVIKYVKKVHQCFLMHCDANANNFLK